MTHGLDVVALGIEDISAVVVRVVDVAHSRCTVVDSACLERRDIERVDGLTVLRPERDVEPALDGPPSRFEPEERLPSLPNPAASPTGSERVVSPSGARACS